MLHKVKIQNLLLVGAKKSHVPEEGLLLEEDGLAAQAVDLMGGAYRAVPTLLVLPQRASVTELQGTHAADEGTLF
jgi:hypothetical protein